MWKWDFIPDMQITSFSYEWFCTRPCFHFQSRFQYSNLICRSAIFPQKFTHERFLEWVPSTHGCLLAWLYTGAIEAAALLHYAVRCPFCLSSDYMCRQRTWNCQTYHQLQVRLWFDEERLSLASLTFTQSDKLHRGCYSRCYLFLPICGKQKSLPLLCFSFKFFL